MAARTLAGLFINCVEANDSIHESGKMACRCLLDSEKYTLDYTEITARDPRVSTKYDFYFFNYHIVTMSWLDTASLKKSLPGAVMTMVLEVAPNDPFVYCPPDDFDAYCVLDPTLKIQKTGVFSFPRPLDRAIDAVYEATNVPVIGTFGFATKGKGFDTVVEAVNSEFSEAIVRINIPYAAYADENQSFAHELADLCRSKAASGVEVIVTHDFMTKEQLVRWCGQNTINCFLYDRDMPGLAATTDQAITSGRPLITSKNDTFRHIQKFIKPFPYQTLKQAIENTPSTVAQIQRDWAPERFRERFEAVLDNFQFDQRPKQASSIQLPIKEESVRRGFPERARMKLGNMLRRSSDRIGSLPKAFSRKAASYSQFGEDVIISDLLAELAINKISYLDIGANNPKYISNTYLFYEKGFRGVLVEPNEALCRKLKDARPGDTIVNAGIGIDNNVSEAEFYVFPEACDGLSTFSRNEATHWEEVGMGGTKFHVEKTIKVRLVNINSVISDHFTECPDIISIDTEGWDLQILKTLDFDKYNPAVFCVETLAYNDDGSTYRDSAIVDLMENKGYFAFKETYANTIFVNRNLYNFYLYRKGARRRQ